MQTLLDSHNVSSAEGVVVVVDVDEGQWISRNVCSHRLLPDPNTKVADQRLARHGENTESKKSKKSRKSSHAHTACQLTGTASQLALGTLLRLLLLLCLPPNTPQIPRPPEKCPFDINHAVNMRRTPPRDVFSPECTENSIDAKHVTSPPHSKDLDEFRRMRTEYRRSGWV